MRLLQKLRPINQDQFASSAPGALRGLSASSFNEGDRSGQLDEKGVIVLPSQMLSDEAWEKLTALSYALKYMRNSEVHINTFYRNHPHVLGSRYVGKPEDQCEDALRLLQPIESNVRAIENFGIYLSSITALKMESGGLVHSHPHDEITAVVYLDIKGKGGELAFEDPATKTWLTWTPLPRSIVLIRKEIQHKVLPVEEGGMRRSLTMFFNRAASTSEL